MNEALHPEDFQRDKLAMLGQLSAGVAHELNNPIGYIASNITTLHKYQSCLFQIIEEASSLLADNDIFQQSLDNNKWNFIKEDLPNLLNDSQNGTELLIKLVTDLKSLARSNNSRELIQLHDCIRSALNILQHQLKQGCELELELLDNPAFYAVRPQIIQAIINILHNALQAQQQNGRILIRTKSQNNYCSIFVADDGPGVPDDKAETIFKLYETHKENGTGLGLPIVRQICREHGGDCLLVTNPIYQGACFELRFAMDAQ